MNFFASYIKLLPKWVLTSITFVLVAYIGALLVVAVTTERDVKFWPPEIGPGPKSKMVEEFKSLRFDMNGIIHELLDQRKKLNDRLNEARSSEAVADANHNTMESIAWSVTSGKIETEIKNLDEKLIIKIEEVRKLAQETEMRFNGL